jgi:hypothetical protein
MEERPGHRQPAHRGVAVVSCHVEKMLDDDAWRQYSRIAATRPGGFSIASLMRPPDGPEWDSSGRWTERAHVTADWGPVGLHTHYGSATMARPGPNPVWEPAARVENEAAWMCDQGIAPRFFCGGGWYIDADVARVLARSELTDSTATRFWPNNLPPGAPRLSLDEPTEIVVPGYGSLAEIPSTHSVGMLWRGLLHRTLPEFVHFYFHDYDLIDPRRRLAIWQGLRVLSVFRRPADLASEAVYRPDRSRVVLPLSDAEVVAA